MAEWGRNFHKDRAKTLTKIEQMENDDFVKKWLNEKEIFLLDDEYLRISKLYL